AVRSELRLALVEAVRTTPDGSLQLHDLHLAPLERLLLGRGELLRARQPGFAVGQRLLAGAEPLVAALLELFRPCGQIAGAEREIPLALGKLTGGMLQLALTGLERLAPARQLAFPGFQLVAERLLPLGDADPFGFELLGDALLAVSGLGLSLFQLALELLDPC